jgi:hypothetical protein
MRKLKTFVTTIGFFEMAVAAPSMKAALEAWEVTQNLFHQGFAKETDDPAIIAAAIAHPGTVLKRAVGSTGRFTEHAELPENLPVARNKMTKAVKTTDNILKRAARTETSPATTRVQKASFEKAQARREELREKEHAQQAAVQARKDEARRKAAEKIQRTLDKSDERHTATMLQLERESDDVQQRIDAESKRWKTEEAGLQRRLKDAAR